MEVMKINAVDFGVEENKAKEVSALYKPMLDKMEELEGEFNEVVTLEMSVDKVKRAKLLRSQYVKTRTGTAKVHKSLKSNILKVGKFIDGWKNSQALTCEGYETTLKEIETHYENVEKLRVELLNTSRADEIRDLVDVIPNELGLMSDDVWNMYLTGLKEQVRRDLEVKQIEEEARLRAELEEKKRVEVEMEKRIKEQEEARIEKERIEKENAVLKEKLRLEEDKAKKEKTLRIKEERVEKARIAEESRLKQIEIDKENAIRAEKQRIEQDKINKEKQESLLRERKLLDESNKLKAEAKKREDLEKKRLCDIEKAKAEAIEIELKKGDGEKMGDVARDIQTIIGKYSFKSEANKILFDAVKGLLSRVIKYMNVKEA